MVTSRKVLFIVLALVSTVPLGLAFIILIPYLLATFIWITEKVPPGQGILFEARTAPYYVSVKMTPISVALCFLLGFVSSVYLLRRFRGI